MTDRLKPADRTRAPKTSTRRSAPETVHTLSIDIGGSHVKATVLDATGAMTTDRVRLPTPKPCTPEALLSLIETLVKPLPESSRVSVGFPGVVRSGRILTAPNLGNELWHGFELADGIATLLGKPTRVLNDGEMQGLGVISGVGLEIVITLGTGMGFAVFLDGALAPKFELSQHPFRKNETYDEQIGQAALEQIGPKKWNRRVEKAIACIRTLTNFDRLYIGGGNAGKLSFTLPDDATVVANTAGLLGGIALWLAPAAIPALHQRADAAV